MASTYTLNTRWLNLNGTWGLATWPINSGGNYNASVLLPAAPDGYKWVINPDGYNGWGNSPETSASVGDKDVSHPYGFTTDPPTLLVAYKLESMAPPSVPTSAQILDRFTRTNSLTVGNGWSQSTSNAAGGSSLSLLNNTLAASTNINGAMGANIYRASSAYRWSVGPTQYSAIAWKYISNTSTNALQQYARIATSGLYNTGNGYMFGRSSTAQLALLRGAGSTNTSLGTIPFTFTPGDVFSMIVETNPTSQTVHCYANGVEVITAPDNTFSLAAESIPTLYSALNLFTGAAGVTSTNQADDLMLGSATLMLDGVMQPPQGYCYVLPGGTWNTAPDGSGTTYTEGSLLDLTSDLGASASSVPDMVLYAVKKSPPPQPLFAFAGV